MPEYQQQDQRGDAQEHAEQMERAGQGFFKFHIHGLYNTRTRTYEGPALMFER